MIKLSMIDENLSIYKDNIVVFLGYSSTTMFLFNMFKQNNIRIDYLCCSNKNSWYNSIEEIPFICTSDLELLLSNIDKLDNSSKIVVQFSSDKIHSNIVEQLLSIGINTIIPYEEAYSVLYYKIKKTIFKNNLFLKEDYFLQLKNSEIERQYEVNEYLMNNFYRKQFLFICMMPKTGDHTLTKTFLENNIPCYFTVHNTKVLEKVLSSNIAKTKKIKITTGLRDPLSASISLLYQDFGVMHYTETMCRFDLESHSWLEVDLDVQKIFDEKYNYSNEKENPISSFMERFKESILDLSKYQFDQVKGYTIIKEGNVEVFVYQLEKLNDIVKEMSDWVGETSFDKWNMGNDSSSKWISKSYKQAQKELQISQEFFDKCYNNEWVEHFYSNEDIEKFKSRWKNQVIS